MATERIRIKLGDTEIEFEGEKDFARLGVLKLLEDALEIAPRASVITPPFTQNREASSDLGEEAVNSGMTVASIAAHLEPRGTQDLALCALARLQVVLGKDQATKAEIWEEMKGATGYFKTTMNKHFPRDLRRMVKGKKINEVAAGAFVLSAAKRRELEAKIAEIE